MLACGRAWQPSRVKRVIETLHSSTRVAKVATDADIGFLKGMGNPAGLDSLACELVGSELAQWFGLQTPPFALLRVANLEIPMSGIERPMEPGPAFISREIMGSTSDGSDAFLPLLRNPEDVSKVVVFDTWIRNGDRYPADKQEQEAVANRDNIFFSPSGAKFDLIVFDHTHCFVDSTLEDGLDDTYLVEDDRIYGNFPEFANYICESDVRAAVGKLRQLDPAIVKEIMDSVPADWRVTSAVRKKWAEVICKRALLVADFMVPKLIPNAGLCL
jgi:HipA-like protein